MFPYNAGVMMLNMPFMKRTNDEFIDWILRQHNGLDYGRKHLAAAAAAAAAAAFQALSVGHTLAACQAVFGATVRRSLARQHMQCRVLCLTLPCCARVLLQPTPFWTRVRSISFTRMRSRASPSAE